MKNIWLGPWAVFFSCVKHAKNSDICSFEAKLTVSKLYLGFLEIDKFISKLAFGLIQNSLLVWKVFFFFKTMFFRQWKASAGPMAQGTLHPFPLFRVFVHPPV